MAYWHWKLTGPVAAISVMLVVTLTNTGAKPLTYWNGGPGRFPGGQEFQAILTSEGAAAKDVKASNGQYEMGSGRSRSLSPGESMDVPLALPPQAPGNYRLNMKGWRWDLDDGAIGLCRTGGHGRERANMIATLMKRIEGGDFLADACGRRAVADRGGAAEVTRGSTILRSKSGARASRILRDRAEGS